MVLRLVVKGNNPVCLLWKSPSIERATSEKTLFRVGAIHAFIEVFTILGAPAGFFSGRGIFSDGLLSLLFDLDQFSEFRVSLRCTWFSRGTGSRSLCQPYPFGLKSVPISRSIGGFGGSNLFHFLGLRNAFWTVRFLWNVSPPRSRSLCGTGIVSENRDDLA